MSRRAAALAAIIVTLTLGVPSVAVADLLAAMRVLVDRLLARLGLDWGSDA